MRVVILKDWYLDCFDGGFFMRKYIIAVVIISMLVLCSCGVDKTIVKVEAQSAKMTFKASNSSLVSKIPKEYHVEKVGEFEKYTKSEIQSKNFNVFDREYRDLEYYQSEKNTYTGEDYDVYKNNIVEIEVSPTGDISSFFVQTPIKVFENENEHSDELAKKYLEMIFPDYKYDDVLYTQTDILDCYDYTFVKFINGVRTSDCIGITLNSVGELRSYFISDVGKYDNIAIKGVDTDVLLERIDNYVKDAYGDMVIDNGISDDGPYYSIFVGTKIELSFPIWIKVKDSTGHESTIPEIVVFELN